MSHWRPSQAAWLSVISNSTLVLLKIVVGLVIGSVAVLSEAIHSGVDLLAALIALFAVRTAARPPDLGHPYGHGKFENVSGTVEALLIFAAAGWIIYESVSRLLHPEPLTAPAAGVAVMGLSVLVNTLVSEVLFRVGDRHDSVALKADAWHLRTDVYTSLGVCIGLAFILLHERFFPTVNVHWVDPVAALIVALLICQAAYRLTIQSARDLMDASLPLEEELWICQSLREMLPRVQGFHKLRTRKSGARRFMDVHMLVEPQMSVAEAHLLADEVVARIKSRYPETLVIVHIEPASGEASLDCDGRLSDGR